jgi:large subunit ribosomal protein L14
MRVGSVVRVADNSGVCFLRIIKVLRKKPLAEAKLSDVVIGSAIRIHQRKKFKLNKGTICRALVVRTAETSQTRFDGHRIRFQYPAVVIITKKGLPRSTKIYGPVPKELRELGYIRVVSLSTIAL